MENRKLTNEELVKEIVKDAIRQSFKHFGIEGTEEKIKELYVANPELQQYMLKTYVEMIR